MRKIVSLLLTLAVVLSALTACGQAGNSEAAGNDASGSESVGAFDPTSPMTMGDVYAHEDKADQQWAFSETKYVYVFSVDGVYYRAALDLPKDVYDAIEAIEYDDEDRDQKIADLLSPLEITSLDNLSEQAPSQEELVKLVGKTGQDLFIDGWEYWYYNLDEMEAGMNSGPYSYVVKFEYDGEPMENSDDFDFYEEFKDLRVSSVTLEGIGNAANPE